MPVRTFQTTITDALAGVRLDRAIATLWPELSRKMAQRIIEAGGAHLNGTRTHVPATPLAPGHRLRICVDPSAPFRTFRLDPARILREDRWILVIDKPSGTPVNLSATGQEGSVQRGVEEYLASTGCAHHPAVLHRLDMGTSGILLFAKDKETEKSLYALFRDRKIEKQYLALALPGPQPATGTIRTNIAKCVDRLNQYRVSRERGKEAITRYESLPVKEEPGLSLVRVWPLTGRPHQIRVHLAWRGAPILGDTLYGGQAHDDLFGLHAFQIRFPHPRSREIVTVQTAPPEEWIQHFPSVLDLTSAHPAS